MKTLSERHRLLARRAAYWALLGAFSGAVAWGLAWLFYRSYWQTLNLPTFQARVANPIPSLILPGLLFGLVAGFELWRQRLASPWQGAALTVASILSWVCEVATIIAVTLILDLDVLPMTMFLGGTVWGAVQASGAAAIFRFARQLGLWFALTTAGGITAWVAMLMVPPDAIRGFVLLPLWSIGYAVHAAILSTALPFDGE